MSRLRSMQIAMQEPFFTAAARHSTFLKTEKILLYNPAILGMKERNAIYHCMINAAGNIKH